MSDFGRILTPMVTPFDAKGEVDYAVAAQLMQFLVENGSDGIVVAGTTGESPTLTDTEKLRLFELAVSEIGGRASILAGTGSNNTAHTVELTEQATRLGVDGHLVVTPYYNKPPRAGIIEHFKTVAAATNLPLMLYNVPARCVINLEPDLLAELSEIDNIVAVKQCNTDLNQARFIVDSTSLDLYTGDDNMLLPFMELGAHGGVCASAHLIGAQMGTIIDDVLNGELESARKLDESIAEVYETLFITSCTITVKAALELLGIPVGGVRLPLVVATDSERETVKALLEKHDLIALAQ